MNIFNLFLNGYGESGSTKKYLLSLSICSYEFDLVKLTKKVVHQLPNIFARRLINLHLYFSICYEYSDLDSLYYHCNIN